MGRKTGINGAGAEQPHQEHKRATDDGYADKQLNEGRPRLSSMPLGAFGRHLTAWSSPYMGMITEMATKPTAAPTAMMSAGSIRAIMFRTL